MISHEKSNVQKMHIEIYRVRPCFGIDSLVKHLGYVDEANFAMDVNLGDEGQTSLGHLGGLAVSTL